jgi:phage tail protein X
MPKDYTTRQGEMIDMICRQAYGDESGFVELVLNANPGLADLPAPLPIGTKITLPDQPKAPTSRVVIALYD